MCDFSSMNKKFDAIQFLLAMVIIILMVMGTWMFGKGSAQKKELFPMENKNDVQIANPYDTYDTSDVDLDIYKTLKKSNQQIELVGENSI